MNGCGVETWVGAGWGGGESFPFVNTQTPTR